METTTNLPIDALAGLANPETQKRAARMAQEVFTGLFRLSAAPEEDASEQIKTVENRCFNWTQAGETPEAKALRLALLISGLDQWGLAYSQAFNLTAIPALSTLIGQLRQRLDQAADARFQWFFSQIDQIESDAIDFKVDLRRHIHLALWHAMVNCESEEAAQAILIPLGSLLLALNEKMPTLGWRLTADALANIQVALLQQTEQNPLAQQSTGQLFASLQQALPEVSYKAIMAQATQVVLAWQQASRANGPH